MQQLHTPAGILYGQPAVAPGKRSPATTPAVSEMTKASPVVPSPQEEKEKEKVTKRDKTKSSTTKLVYSDNEVSPEEKMARFARYAFIPDRKEKTVVGGGPAIALTGTIRDSDDVIDVTHD